MAWLTTFSVKSGSGERSAQDPSSGRYDEQYSCDLLGNNRDRQADVPVLALFQVLSRSWIT